MLWAGQVNTQITSQQEAVSEEMAFRAEDLCWGMNDGRELADECRLGSHLHPPKGRAVKSTESRQYSGWERGEENH